MFSCKRQFNLREYNPAGSLPAVEGILTIGISTFEMDFRFWMSLLISMATLGYH